ncbi:MAG: hypothetical protein NVSMB1_14120 [Polyangiales bacterium]
MREMSAATEAIARHDARVAGDAGPPSDARIARIMASPGGGRGVWLFSPSRDIFAFLVVPIIALSLASLGPLLGIEESPTWVFLFCVVAVDVSHVHGTLYRVYFDRQEIMRRPVLYLGTPLLAYTLGFALHRLGGALLFWRVLAYLAVFHFIRQQVGWVALYRARGGETQRRESRFDAFLDPLAVYAATLYPLIVWHLRLPRNFHWFVASDFVHGLSPNVELLARAVWLTVLLAFLARQAQLVIERRRVNIGKVMVVLSTFALWWGGIVFFDSDYAFTVTNVLPHGIPYLFLIETYSIARYRDGRSKPVPFVRRLLSHGFAMGFALLVMLALIEELAWDRFVWHDHGSLFGNGRVVAITTLSWLVPLLALPQVVHYVLDGFIWKRSQNPSLGNYLSRAPARNRPAQQWCNSA